MSATSDKSGAIETKTVSTEPVVAGRFVISESPKDEVKIASSAETKETAAGDSAAATGMDEKAKPGAPIFIVWDLNG
mgnify:CR=1 FL=1